MATDLSIPVVLSTSDLSITPDIGHTVVEVVAPQTYAGETTITPTTEEQVLETQDMLLSSDITIESAPTSSLEVDALTGLGTYTPDDPVVGFSSVTVEEEWDGTLYPIEGDEYGIFNAKHLAVSAGDTVIIDGVGRGRWFGFYRGLNRGDYSVNNVNLAIKSDNGFSHIRFELPIDKDTTVVVAGYEWTNDGEYATNEAYQFRGEYLHYRVISST